MAIIKKMYREGTGIPSTWVATEPNKYLFATEIKMNGKVHNGDFVIEDKMGIVSVYDPDVNLLFGIGYKDEVYVDGELFKAAGKTQKGIVATKNFSYRRCK